MIAEDHKMFREVIAKSISEASSRIKVIATAENGIELMDAIKKNTPDIVLLDIYMPEMNGWKVLEILKVDFPSVKTIMFSGEFDNAHVAHTVLGGARAFLDKWKSDENDIIAAIESVYEHGYYFNDVASREIVISLKNSKQIPPLDEDPQFSEREKDVIELICEGKQIKEIAADLNISNGTVKYHKGNVFKKTDSNTNMDLLKYAISRGIFNVFQPKLIKKKS